MVWTFLIEVRPFSLDSIIMSAPLFSIVASRSEAFVVMQKQRKERSSYLTAPIRKQIELDDCKVVARCF